MFCAIDRPTPKAFAIAPFWPTYDAQLCFYFYYYYMSNYSIDRMGHAITTPTCPIIRTCTHEELFSRIRRSCHVKTTNAA